MTDVSGLSPAELRSYSWHDPSKAPAAPGTGHLPQVETPEELLGALLDLGHD